MGVTGELLEIAGCCMLAGSLILSEAMWYLSVLRLWVTARKPRESPKPREEAFGLEPCC